MKMGNIWIVKLNASLINTDDANCLTFSDKSTFDKDIFPMHPTGMYFYRGIIRNAHCYVHFYEAL